MHRYTEEELAYIREIAPGKSHKEITEALNRRFSLDLSVSAVKACLERYSIRTGRTGRFEPGSIPANKGKKMKPEAYEKCAPTMFKKGDTPINHKPIGTISVRHNYKRGQMFVYEKVAEPNVWRMKHVLEWEKHNGPVPKGKIIIFADGDPLNTDIGNLVMIDRSQNAVMNRWGIRGSDKGSMEAAAKVASLKSQIAKRKRGKKHGSSKRTERRPGTSGKL